MRLAGYARVSTPTLKGALPLQVEAIERWCKAFGHEVLMFEEVESAGPGKERPVFSDMMRRTLGDEFDGVVVGSLDRFGRSFPEMSYESHRLDEVDKALITVKQNIDTSTKEGRFLFRILMAVADLEREMIRDRMAAGRERARRLGKKLGGPEKVVLPREDILLDLGRGDSIGRICRRYDMSSSTLYRRLSEWHVNLEELRSGGGKENVGIY